MLTKTRATIIALITSAGFASAAIAPAVSSADQKLSPGTHAATCEVYRLTYELWNELQGRAEANGQSDLAEYYAGLKDTAAAAAKTENCAWSSVALPKTVTLPVTAIKPIGLKPAAQR